LFEAVLAHMYEVKRRAVTDAAEQFLGRDKISTTGMRPSTLSRTRCESFASDAQGSDSSGDDHRLHARWIVLQRLEGAVVLAKVKLVRDDTVGMHAT